MNEQEKKLSRQNIRLMIIIAVMLLAGIIIRRNFIASELKATLNNMFPSADSIKTTHPGPTSHNHTDAN